MPQTALNPAAATVIAGGTVGAPMQNYGKTLMKLREELFLGLGGRSDASSRLDAWINDAYVDLVTSLQLDELRSSIVFSTVAGQGLYLMPTVVDTLISVNAPTAGDMQGYPLTKIDLASFRDLETAGGAPRTFFRYGQLLVLWPNPASVWTLNIDFRMRPQPLVADEDSPIVGLEWHRAILLGAKAMAHYDLLENDLAALAENKYLIYVRRRRDRQADEDENRVLGSSVPRRLSELRQAARRAPYREI